MESKERHLIRHYLILILFLLFLGGCAQKINQQAVLYDDWKTQLTLQNNWRVEGKLAFISPEERQSANLNWQQKQALNELVLTSFIGTRILGLKQTATSAELKYDGETYHDTNASRLLSRLTGFTIPLDNAKQWLKGTVTDGEITLDSLERTQQVSYIDNTGLKWLIEYGEYQQIEGYWLPKKLTLKHQQLKIKIQLYQWHFN